MIVCEDLNVELVITEINTANNTVGSRGVKNENFPRKVMS